MNFFKERESELTSSYFYGVGIPSSLGGLFPYSIPILPMIEVIDIVKTKCDNFQGSLLRIYLVVIIENDFNLKSIF